MKVKYVGKSFGVDSLTDGRIYEVLCYESNIGALRLIDDSGEDYLYSPRKPKPLCEKEAFGRFEVVEDDENGTLDKVINRKS